MVFQIQNFCQMESWYSLCYSRNDHDLLYQFNEAQVFSEVICHRVDFQKMAFQTHFGYSVFLIMFFEATMLNGLLMSHGPRQPRQVRVMH